MKLKHTMISRGQLFYQRRYPTKLRHHPQVTKPLYRKALKVRVDDSEEAKLRAWKSADKTFTDWVELLSLANADALEQRRKQEMAQALVEASGLEVGMLAPDPMLTELQNQALRDDAYEVVEQAGVFDEMVRHGHEEASDELTPQLEVQSIAWRLLSEPKTAALSAVMLSDCWESYVEWKDIDVSTRDGARQKRRWQKFLSIAGDSVLTQDSVHSGLDSYVADREGEVKGSSIAREVASIVAVIRHTVRKLRLPIAITKPAIKGATDYAERYTFTEHEQQQLLGLAAEQVGWKEAVLLLMIQSGCITTELQRLKTENVHLEGEVPYILIAGQKTKTEARQRVVPIVVGVDRLLPLLAELGDDSGYALGSTFARMSDSNISHQLKTVIKRINENATAYSLRHTMKNNGLAAGVDSGVLALIGGWSSSLAVNTIQQQYGSGGRLYEGTLKRLQAAMRAINHHLISSDAVSNVIPMVGS